MKVLIFLAFVLFFLIKTTTSQYYKQWENSRVKYPQNFQVSKSYKNNYENHKNSYGNQGLYGIPNTFDKQKLYGKSHSLDLIEIDDQITEIALKAETYLDAEKFARKFGFKNLGRVSNLPNTYNLVKDKSETNRYPRKSNYSDQINHHKKVFLNYKHKIYFVENQVPLKRYKRDYLDEDTIDSLIDDELLLNRASNSRQGYLLNFPFFSSSKSEWNSEKTKPVVFENGPVFFHTEEYSNLGFNKNKLSSSNKNHHLSNQQVPNLKGFNDELFEKQWYLNEKFSKDSLAFNSLNVKEAWNLGYTGKGVVVTVIDDGLEWNHTDLVKNYDPKASIDLNGRDDDPSPSYSDENAHGTRCAGEIAMTAGNRKCGVGIAYNAKIGGIRLLDGSVVDIKEAQSFLHNFHYVDIYSSSWGPNDDGETLDGPKPLAKEALQRGAEYGRKGLGNIYVWASGNGGRKGDNCNCDGYVGSIYTLAIGSVGQNGQFPWYGERCSAIHAVTYSSNSASEEKIATTDIRNLCTIQHSGTSAAAPLAAGILALLLEANRNLTWRDVQHLVVWTSNFLPMRKSPGWRQNKVGLLYNDRFGFGMMNAGELVKKSINWKQVPPFHSCTINLKRNFPIYFDEVEPTLITFESNSCRGTGNEVNFIEHVQILLDIKLPVRGQLEIFLVSPSGTGSILLTKRKNDATRMGFTNWNFTSVHFWGEQPSGTWKLFLKRGGLGGEVSFAKLFIHGTSEKPNHMIEEPKKIYRSFNGNLNSILDYTMEFDNELKKKKTEQNLYQDIYDWSKKIQDVNDYNDDDMMVGRSGKINFGSFKKSFRKHF